MKSLNDLTVIIVTFNTPRKVILDCINSISKNVNILIVENSESFIDKNLVLTKFSNVNVVCTGENLGYGKGNNFGINQVKTDYVLILNPDVICDEKFFTNISTVVEEAKDFTIIGCQYLSDNIFMPAGFFDKKKNNSFVKDFRNNKLKSLSSVDWVVGCSMLIDLKKFSGKNIFDENFFLYFEEIDLCKRVKMNDGKIYLDQSLKVYHEGAGSVDYQNKEELEKNRNWHWMWSTFYYHKKYKGFLVALIIILPKLFSSFIKTIFFLLIFNKKKKDIYLNRLSGISNSILGNKSWRRPNID